jgi:hypothetical protein
MKTRLFASATALTVALASGPALAGVSVFGSGYSQYEMTYYLYNLGAATPVYARVAWFQDGDTASDVIADCISLGNVPAAGAAGPASLSFTQGNIEDKAATRIRGLYWMSFYTNAECLNTTPPAPPAAPLAITQPTAGAPAAGVWGQGLLGTMDNAGNASYTTIAFPTEKIVPVAVAGPPLVPGVSTLSIDFASGNPKYEQTFWIANNGAVDVAVTVTAYGASGAAIGTADADLGSIQANSAVGYSVADLGEAIKPGTDMDGLWSVEFTLTNNDTTVAAAVAGVALLGTPSALGANYRAPPRR